MGKKIEQWLEQYRCMDWAVLYMRLFAGCMMLFHNIGKMQNYNEIIGSYPSFLFFSPTTVFVAIAAAEVLLSALIMLGVWVRMSALLMALGVLAMLVWSGLETGVKEFLWIGIYIFLIISGSGLYGFDEVLATSGRKK